jgi:hypothetical protein
MGAVGIKGQALLGLGTIFSALGQTKPARDALDQSVAIFSHIDATHHLNQARDVLNALKTK